MNGAGQVSLLPRATLGAVMRGEARLVGARCTAGLTRGVVSPIEARVNMGIPYDDLADEERRYASGRSLRRDVGVLLRAAVSRLFAPSLAGERAPRPWVVSARVDNVTITDAVDRIVAPNDGPRARVVHFVHPHALNLATFDPGYARLLSQAALVLPDGVGIRLASALLGTPILHNVNGTDLLPLLCRRLAASGIPLVLIGGAEGVARDAGEQLSATYPRLRIAFTSHGFLDAAASRALADRVREVGRCVVLVGMGSPMQERWVWQHLAGLGGCTAITVGGLFDFYSGRVPRAPIALRELGLEWTFRLAHEPRRLAARYLLGNPLFLALAARQRWLPSLGRRPDAPSAG